MSSEQYIIHIVEIKLFSDHLTSTIEFLYFRNGIFILKQAEVISQLLPAWSSMI